MLLADDAVAMRAALRGPLEDNGLPVIGEAAADGLQASPWPHDSSPTEW